MEALFKADWDGLKPKCYVNERLINTFLKVTEWRSHAKDIKVMAMPISFFERWIDRWGYEKMKRSVFNNDPFKKDVVFSSEITRPLGSCCSLP